MTSRPSPLFITLLAFSLGLGGLAAKPPAAQAKTKALGWETAMELGQDVFPSLLISTATVNWFEDAEPAEDEVPTLGDPNGWFGVWLENVPAGAKIAVEISSDGWMKPSRFEGVVKKAAEEIYVQPKGIFDYDALHKVREQKPVNMTFKVTVNGEVLGEKNETLIMHSLNECPFLVDYGDDEEPLDLTWTFAAYVNENHPWIDGLLKEALQTGLVDSFTGYQSEDPEVVITQVFAIWHVLQRRGIKYSDISTTPGAKDVYSQTVRFLDDSVDATQANCVDGSVLMASVLRKIGLNVYLVMVPGHCYLAFDADAEGNAILGLETTMLGDTTLKPVAMLPKLAEKARLKEFKASFRTFEAALGTATEDLEENAELFDAEDELEYQLISIDEAREFGIMPIATGRTK